MRNHCRMARPVRDDKDEVPSTVLETKAFTISQHDVWRIGPIQADITFLRPNPQKAFTPKAGEYHEVTRPLFESETVNLANKAKIKEAKAKQKDCDFPQAPPWHFRTHTHTPSHRCDRHRYMLALLTVYGRKSSSTSLQNICVVVCHTCVKVLCADDTHTGGCPPRC
jgi:hypothetical protein